MPMFKKILIANRGEIACRIIKTAKKMGIQTVAVFSQADQKALHVRMADEAVFIGEAPASESYLVIEKIIKACKDTGAEAVHPGYGFLSENAGFANALKEAGIAFIGPSASAIEAMGDKITSKKIADEAGVSTVPGFMGIINDAEQALSISRDIGYPVMIKASAGGGGKGMRIAYRDEDVKEGFERSKSEAASSFGDDRIFIEKFITEPRHIEIQVLADQQGNVIYLGERECSIQRRNQKVIEEAPSPFLDEKTRRKMGEQSVALSKSVGYSSAGTVEFIVDKNKNFYFLEMNTRLQVEHPVTELITGIDLVEQMIRVASGEPLSIKQEDVKLNGWAIESRVYAEDPYRNFMPSIGRLTKYRPPENVSIKNGEIRNDTGVYEGSEISMYYDPMIAKLCTWAPTRSEAITGMQSALDHFEINGIGHNMSFLMAVMGHQRFQAGNLTTAFIAEEYPEGFQGVELDTKPLTQLALSASVLHYITQYKAVDEEQELSILIGKDKWSLKICKEEKQYQVKLDDKTYWIKTYWQKGDTLANLEINDETIVLQLAPVSTGYKVLYRGADLTIHVMRPKLAELFALMPEKKAADTSNMLLCPMPGRITSIMAEEGQQIEDGQSLAIVEAMKMENILKAERKAVVKKIYVKEDTNLSVDEVIMEFE